MASSNGDSSDVVHHEANTKAFIGSNDLGVGDLYICKSCVKWTSAYDSKVLNLEYKRVALHAVSRAGESFMMPCLFCMVDGAVSTGSAGEAPNATAGRREVNVVEMSEESATEAATAAGSDDDGDVDDDGDEEDEETTEIRFAPEEPDHLDAMYTSMSQCQLLHPDTDDEDEHQLGEGSDSIMMENITSMEGFFTSAEDVVHLTTEGQRVLEHLNAVTVEAPAASGEPSEEGQFDDA